MATLGIQVTPTGVIFPSFSDVLAQLQNLYWGIYGTDAQLSPDTADGQFLAVLAQAITDCNNGAAAVYQSFSPTYAQGAGLASLVKLNGLTKLSPSNSQAVVLIVGQVGLTITDGVVGDNLNLGTQWTLPDSVTIPDAGQIAVTATCTTAGAVQAGANTLTKILTPTNGWQTVNNAAAAVPGAPVESDSALRQRQAASTALPALSVIEGIYAAIAAIPGVSELSIYENASDVVDGNGLPPHSISVVALGGDINTIAQTIALKKTPGTGTHGNTSVIVIDQNGVPSTINFNELSLQPMAATITVQPLTGYTTAIGVEIQTAVANFVNSLTAGETSYLNRLIAAASLGGTGDGATFVVTGVVQAIKPAGQTAADVPFAYNQQATLAVGDITLTVL